MRYGTARIGPGRTGLAPSSQRGQGMSEYIIVVALIAITAIVVVAMFGGTLRAQFSGVAHELSGQSAGSAIVMAQSYAQCAYTDASTPRDGMAGYANDVDNCGAASATSGSDDPFGGGQDDGSN